MANLNWRNQRSKCLLNCNLTLVALFLLVITVSVVLTVLTLHLNRLNIQPNLISIHQPHHDGALTHHQLPTIESKRSDQNSSLNTAGHRIYKYHFNKINSKVNALRPPYLPSEKRKPGWRVLTGNVVVHEGHVDNPHNFTYTVNSLKACDALNMSDAITVLIFVESEVKNFERRRVIRETWGLPMLQNSQNVKLVFMLGASASNRTRDEVNREFYTYGDVVQEDFKENFKHLTLKTVMGLKWAQIYCQQADFVVKTDDDILIHVPNLVKLLQMYTKRAKRLLLCHKNHSRRIERMGKVYAKYQVSPFELPGSFFPEYCSGFTYIMSRDVVRGLYEASISTPYFFIEDVYVTGFCRHKAGIKLVDDPHIALKPYITADSAPCDFAEGRITSQELSTQETQGLWTGLNTRGFFCPVLVKDLSLIKQKRERLKRVKFLNENTSNPIL